MPRTGGRHVGRRRRRRLPRARPAGPGLDRGRRPSVSRRATRKRPCGRGLGWRRGRDRRPAPARDRRGLALRHLGSRRGGDGRARRPLPRRGRSRSPGRRWGRRARGPAPERRQHRGASRMTQVRPFARCSASASAAPWCSPWCPGPCRRSNRPAIPLAGGRGHHVRSPPGRLRLAGYVALVLVALLLASLRLLPQRWGERSTVGRQAVSPAPSAAWSGRRFSCSASCPLAPPGRPPSRRRLSWPPPTSRQADPRAGAALGPLPPVTPTVPRPPEQRQRGTGPRGCAANTVAVGDSFWSIAEAQVTIRLGRTPTDAEVVEPWLGSHRRQPRPPRRPRRSRPAPPRPGPPPARALIVLVTRRVPQRQHEPEPMRGLGDRDLLLHAELEVDLAGLRVGDEADERVVPRGQVEVDA